MRARGEHDGTPLGVEALTDGLDALLPQTQCGRCGYPGCRPYAQALAAGEADLNRCAPGGRRTIERLGSLLGRASKPLDPDCGPERPRAVALVDEAWCIGCARCLAACPVDAIVGAKGVMHTVIARECTGCELCIEPCPMDCIRLVAVAARAREVGRDAEPRLRWTRKAAERARARYERRCAREAREAEAQAARRRRRLRQLDRGAKRSAIEAALERVRARRAQGQLR